MARYFILFSLSIQIIYAWRWPDKNESILSKKNEILKHHLLEDRLLSAENIMTKYFAYPLYQDGEEERIPDVITEDLWVTNIKLMPVNSLVLTDSFSININQMTLKFEGAQMTDCVQIWGFINEPKRLGNNFGICLWNIKVDALIYLIPGLSNSLNAFIYNSSYRWDKPIFRNFRPMLNRLNTNLEKKLEMPIKFALNKQLRTLINERLREIPESITTIFNNNTSNSLYAIYFQEQRDMMNELVDQIMISVRQNIKDMDKEEIKLPDIEEYFSKRFGFLPLRGKFRAQNGVFRNLASLRRTSPVIIDQLDRGFRIKSAFGLEKAEVVYHNYEIQIWPFTLKGYFRGFVYKNSLYLSRYGYLKPISPESGTIISEDTLNNAIKEFQTFAGVNATGILDPETKQLMELPRCGVKDRVGAGQSRSKRYALQGSRWRVKDLTYRIAKYPRNLDKDKVDRELEKAFNVWSAYTDLKFTQKDRGHVHIEVRFERGEHGDGDPFDGPGGTLAHAYFPVYGGDAHFDDSEQWTIDSYRGTNLFQVAAHEFGHSLGLSHSDVRSALMAPFYRGYEPTFNLDEDDIQAIQSLYGKKKQNTPVATTTTERPTFRSSFDKILCDDPSVRVDTIFNSADGDTYIFKGDKYWKLTEETIASGYPKLISSTWKGLPSSIDAAFTYRNGKTYFFKGSQYWRYVGKRMDGDYPKLISEGFTGIPDNIDAALVWSGNGKIYFYKGSKFWRFDPIQKPPVKNTYPKPISNWEGIPNNLDAAFQYTNGYTYFFKGGKYWRFDDRSFSVDHGNPPFPRPSGFWWFGCPEGTSPSKPRNGGGGLFNFLGFLSRDADIEDDQVDDIILDAVEKPEDRREEKEKPQQAENKDDGSGNNSAAILYISPLLALVLACLVSIR